MNDINLAVEPVPGKAARHAPCQNGRISMTQVIEPSSSAWKAVGKGC